MNDATAAGGQFTAIGAASVNAGDQWAFRASIVGPKIGTPGEPVDGIFRADASGAVPQFETVALVGDPSPLGGTLRHLPSSIEPALNDVGAVVFRSTLESARSSAAILLAPADRGAMEAVVAVDAGEGGGRLRRVREALLRRTAASSCATPGRAARP